MAVDSAHQIRVVACRNRLRTMPRSARSSRRTWRRLERTAAHPWQPVVSPHCAKRAPVGTPEHARESHEAALALHRSKQFRGLRRMCRCRWTSTRRLGPSATAPASTIRRRWTGSTNPALAEGNGADVERYPRRVGISVGQPDSGYTLHPNLGAAGWTSAGTAMSSTAMTTRSMIWFPTRRGLCPTPATVRGRPASLSGKERLEGIVGLAGSALLVPIRATESVVQVFDTNVAKAVAHARQWAVTS